jgi:hypothetical protein
MSKAAELAALIGSGQAQGDKNIVINGAMQVAQRATSVTGLGTTDTSGTYHTLDRFIVYANNTAGRFTMSQSTVTDLPGFANALKLDCTTADTSIAADEYILFGTRFEAQNLQSLKKGTSSAEPVTISFYVKGNANATYVLEIFDNDNSRTINKTFPVTSSWNRVSITYPGDTAGSGLGDDNDIGLQLVFWLHAGSNSTSGSLQTSWGAYDQTKRAAGISSFVDSTDRTLEITGLQMEIGEVATPFEHEDIGTTLEKCKRYFENVELNNYVIFGNSYTTTQFVLPQIIWKVEKRTAPTLTFPTIGTSSGNVAITKDDGNYVTQGSVIRAFITTTGAAPYNNNADGYSGLTDDSICSLYSVGDSTLKVDAEL